MTNSKIIKPLGDGKRKILSLDEAMRQIDAHQPHKPQTPQESGKPAGTQPEAQPPYLKVEWELEIPKEDNVLTMHYVDGLQRIRNAGYESYPSPQEVFSLIIAHLEGKLVDMPDLDGLAQRLLEKYGMFTRHACKTDTDDCLCVYEDVDSDLRWWSEKRRYEFTPNAILSCNYPRIFFIKGLAVKNFNALSQVNKVNPELIEYFYGRKFEDLPERLKGARIFIPEKPKLSPICIDRPTMDIYCGATVEWPAHGVRKKNG